MNYAPFKATVTFYSSSPSSLPIGRVRSKS